MKHYFIMNPVSGHKRARERFLHTMTDMETDYELIFTTKKGDARAFAEDIANTAFRKDETVRIFACGGDGTVSDIVNGAAGCGDVEIGCIPLGTGNDFIRNFGKKSDFLDVEKYVNGPAVYCDAIRYEAENDGVITKGRCVNMINIGLDCHIVATTDTIKKLPAINGSMAYLTSVFLNLIKKSGEDLKVNYDERFRHDGELLLISVANGCFCGGGIKGLPKARTDDGLMDVSLVGDVSRRDFIRLFPKYAKGTHLDDKLIIRKKLLRYSKEIRLDIDANKNSFKLCVDGEISSQQHLKLEIEPRAFKFIVPEGYMA